MEKSINMGFVVLYEMVDRSYTREELREFARKNSIKCGRNKRDTIRNIINKKPRCLFINLKGVVIH